MKSIQETRLGNRDTAFLRGSIDNALEETIPLDFKLGWAVRPKIAEKGKSDLDKGMMAKLELMFEMGEIGRSKVSSAQAAERLETIKNPDGSFKFTFIPDLCKIMAAFSLIKKEEPTGILIFGFLEIYCQLISFLFLNTELGKRFKCSHQHKKKM